MTKWKVAIGVALVLLAGYVVAAPYITVYQLRSAAQNHDGEALSEHIDFPSVRQSFKDQMNAMFTQQMMEDEEMRDNPFAALGAALAGPMIERLVDAYVSPAGISRLMAGEKTQTDGDTVRDSNSNRKSQSNTTMSYESLNKFVVKVKVADGKDGKFILRRQGFGWKLTDVILPLE